MNSAEFVKGVNWLLRAAAVKTKKNCRDDLV